LVTSALAANTLHKLDSAAELLESGISLLFFIFRVREGPLSEFLASKWPCVCVLRGLAGRGWGRCGSSVQQFSSSAVSRAVIIFTAKTGLKNFCGSR